MPAASQSEPQDAYGEAEKTNTEGCPFWILDAFPSHKYQSSPGTLQNQFTLDRTAILPYKDLKTLGFRSRVCVYVSVCVDCQSASEGWCSRSAVRSFLWSREILHISLYILLCVLILVDENTCLGNFLKWGISKEAFKSFTKIQLQQKHIQRFVLYYIWLEKNSKGARS